MMSKFECEILNEQPAPTNQTGDVWQEIIDSTFLSLFPELKNLCIERRKQGLERYGVTLGRDNGRNHMFDAVQELLDAAVYMKAANQPDWAEPLKLADMLLMRLDKYGNYDNRQLSFKFETTGDWHEYANCGDLD